MTDRFALRIKCGSNTFMYWDGDRRWVMLAKAYLADDARGLWEIMERWVSVRATINGMRCYQERDGVVESMLEVVVVSKATQLRLQPQTA